MMVGVIDIERNNFKDLRAMLVLRTVLTWAGRK